MQSTNNPILEKELNPSSFDRQNLFPETRKASLGSKILLLFVAPIAIVIYIVFTLIFFILYSIGIISCFFPLLEKRRSESEIKAQNRKEICAKHSDFIEIPVPGDINAASKGNPYTISARIGCPTNHNGLPPIIFVEGLMATIFMMIGIQDLFTQAGYYSIVFDRLGVGLTDDFPDTSDEFTCAASAFDVANEMNYVLNYIADNNKYGITRDTKWVASGMSMGGVVAQAFMAIYPNKLCGLHNSDGMPHGMGAVNGKVFHNAGKSWNLFTSLHWTGLTRLMMSSVRKVVDELSYSSQFSVDFMFSFWLTKKTFQATKLENSTMMSCCDLACAAWGNLGGPAMLDNDPYLFYLMCRYPPKEAIEVDDRKSVILPRRVIPLTSQESRSKNELGSDWLSPEEIKYVEGRIHEIADKLQLPDDISSFIKSTYLPDANPRAQPVNRPSGRVGGVDRETVIYPLAPQFKSIAFRSYASRLFIMDNTLLEHSFGEHSYNQTARNIQAYEQSLQAILSYDGARIIYPKADHSNSVHRGESFKYLSECVVSANASNKI